jgi:PKD repeat protein
LIIPFLLLMAIFYSEKLQAQACPCQPIGPELVNNLFFSNACTLPVMNAATNYSSDFTPTNGCSAFPGAPNTFTEGGPVGSPRSTNFIGNWNCPQLELDGVGSRLLIFDGPNSLDPNPSERAWFQTGVNVTQGHSYNFSAFVMNICPGCNPNTNPTFILQVVHPNGAVIQVGNALSPNPCGWNQLCGVFQATATEQVTIQISIPRPAFIGNSGDDGAIDDISFRDITPNSDFTFQRVSCNNPITFTPADGSGTQTWDFGDGTSAGNPHQYASPGSYIVTHTVTTACGSTSTSKIVIVESCCTCQINDPLLQRNTVIDGSFAPNLCPPPFFSEYIFSGCNAGAPPPGSYAETNMANIGTWGRSYCSLKDHSPGNNTDYLLFDGKFIGSNGYHTAWEQQAHVVPTMGQSYCFKASFANPEYAYPAKPSVRLVIVACGVQHVVATLDFLPYNDECGWTTICGCYTPTQSCMAIDSLKIEFASNDCNWANDIAIDDIIFEYTQTECSQSCGTGTEHTTSGYQINPQKKDQFNQNQINDQELNKTMDPSNNNQDNIGIMNVHPIPVTRGADLHVNYNASKEGDVLFQISGNAGNEIISLHQTVKPGMNDVIIKTSILTPGGYVLKATGEAGSQSRVVIVQ